MAVPPHHLPPPEFLITQGHSSSSDSLSVDDGVLGAFGLEAHFQGGSPDPHAESGTHPKGPRENFVHKLHNMVNDKYHSQQISWNWSGTSFIVRNLLDFSREVLPKHFKHNNFASFVRQLNMYGFSKLNKSPRGARTASENQVWEFSHPKFARDRPQLLDDIKRKSVETEAYKRDASDLHGQIQLMHLNQIDMMAQLQRVEDSYMELHRDFVESQRKQVMLQQAMRNMMEFVKQNYALAPAMSPHSEASPSFSPYQLPVSQVPPLSQRPPQPLPGTSIQNHIPYFFTPGGSLSGFSPPSQQQDPLASLAGPGSWQQGSPFAPPDMSTPLGAVPDFNALPEDVESILGTFEDTLHVPKLEP
ncbi:hypothetical protein HKX48_004092 [Thoreauomyces humboldtii]|nr:hypothetical protein HKX48_004092 [Thoreauomyces humboldtii]